MLNRIDQLPATDIELKAHSEALSAAIRESIKHKGPIAFSEFMQMALYHPHYGYYSAGLRKFGRGGDFITAPELSPLYGSCIARQCRQLISHCREAGCAAVDILEFGAGSGKLAAQILTSLDAESCLPDHYYILEVSSFLRDQQQELLKQQLPALFERIIWLDSLDALTINGLIIANEVMDALPVTRFCKQQGQFYETFVDYTDSWQERLKPVNPALAHQLENYEEEIGSLPDKFSSEMHNSLPGWIASASDVLQTGGLLLIDYGYGRGHYYSQAYPQGHLNCYYRHRAHDNPYINIGLQDITAHVDFTRVAESGLEAGMELAGFTSQSQFLMACGLLQLAENAQVDDALSIDVNQQIKQLILPEAMGERFKVMAFNKNMSLDWMGFSLREYREHL